MGFPPTQCHGTAIAFFEFTVWDDTNFWKAISYFYSMTPWLGGFSCLLLSGYLIGRALISVHRRAPERPVTRIVDMWLTDCMECWLFGVCCFIVVPLVVFVAKAIINKPRPDGTCLDSPGMPSGHSATSISVIVYAAFWLLLGRGRKQFSTYAVILWMVGVLLFYGPVAWARTELHDHSLAQVMAGTGVGFVLTVIWCLVLPFSWKGWSNWQIERKSKSFATSTRQETNSEAGSLANEDVTPKKAYGAAVSDENITTGAGGQRIIPSVETTAA